LTFSSLQEAAVPAIIGSPIVVVLSRFVPTKEKDLLKDFPKSPVTSRAFWFLQFYFLHD
jgi:hypothetical protein